MRLRHVVCFLFAMLMVCSVLQLRIGLGANVEQLQAKRSVGGASILQQFTELTPDWLTLPQFVNTRATPSPPQAPEMFRSESSSLDLQSPTRADRLSNPHQPQPPVHQAVERSSSLSTQGALTSQFRVKLPLRSTSMPLDSSPLFESRVVKGINENEVVGRVRLALAIASTVGGIVAVVGCFMACCFSSCVDMCVRQEMRSVGLTEHAVTSLAAAPEVFDVFYLPRAAAQPNGVQQVEQFSPAFYAELAARTPRVVRYLVRELRANMACGPKNDSDAQRKACTQWLLRFAVDHGVTRTSDLTWVLPVVVELAFCDSEIDYVSRVIARSAEARTWHDGFWAKLIAWLRTRNLA